MHPPEDDEYAFCPACAHEVLIFDRVFPLGGQHALCFDCALDRQGVYHDILDRWTVPPQLNDLPVVCHREARGPYCTPVARELAYRGNAGMCKRSLPR